MSVTDFAIKNAVAENDLGSRFRVFQQMYSEGCEAYDVRHQWIREQMGPAIMAAVDLGTSTPRILDIGTGTGLAAQSLSRTVPGGDIYATDFNPEMLRVAQQNGTPNTLLADYQNLPLPSGTFDLITAVLTLTNGCDVPTALNEASRVLRPGGTLAVVESCKDPLAGEVVDAFEKLPQFTAKDIAQVEFHREIDSGRVNFPLFLMTATNS